MMLDQVRGISGARSGWRRVDCIRVLSWNRDILIFGTKRVLCALRSEAPRDFDFDL